MSYNSNFNRPNKDNVRGYITSPYGCDGNVKPRVQGNALMITDSRIRDVRQVVRHGLVSPDKKIVIAQRDGLEARKIKDATMFGFPICVVKNEDFFDLCPDDLQKHGVFSFGNIDPCNELTESSARGFVNIVCPQVFCTNSNIHSTNASWRGTKKVFRDKLERKFFDKEKYYLYLRNKRYDIGPDVPIEKKKNGFLMEQFFLNCLNFNVFIKRHCFYRDSTTWMIYFHLVLKKIRKEQTDGID